jgi:hypothetical protein
MDRQSLKHILADKSVVAAAAVLHVTPRTVYRWCKTRGVAAAILRRLEADGTLQKFIATHRGVFLGRQTQHGIVRFQRSEPLLHVV